MAKPQVVGLIAAICPPLPGVLDAVRSCCREFVASTLTDLTGIIRRHRKAIRSAWRRLNPGHLALLVLVYLCKGEMFTRLSAWCTVRHLGCHGWRYVQEAVALLRARSQKLDQASHQAPRGGLHYPVFDSMLMRTDRVEADRPFYSAEHLVPGMNTQVLASSDGSVLRTFGALPRSAMT